MNKYQKFAISAVIGLGMPLANEIIGGYKQDDLPEEQYTFINNQLSVSGAVSSVISFIK